MKELEGCKINGISCYEVQILRSPVGTADIPLVRLSYLRDGKAVGLLDIGGVPEDKETSELVERLLARLEELVVETLDLGSTTAHSKNKPKGIIKGDIEI
jgi:hypothetical protein